MSNKETRYNQVDDYNKENDECPKCHFGKLKIADGHAELRESNLTDKTVKVPVQILVCPICKEQFVSAETDKIIANTIDMFRERYKTVKQ